jgi:hypothetical protein
VHDKCVDHCCGCGVGELGGLRGLCCCLCVRQRLEGGVSKVGCCNKLSGLLLQSLGNVIRLSLLCDSVQYAELQNTRFIWREMESKKNDRA